MENKNIQSYRDLIVWQKSMDLVVKVYRVTDSYPKTEVYGLTSQTRRSAVSVPSNIAEGRLRGSRKDFRQFLIFAIASGAELETQLEIALRLGYLSREAYEELSLLLTEVMKMLNKLIKTFDVPNS
jgi:four helix bundle protein